MLHCCDESYLDAAGNAVGHWGDGPVHVWLLGHIDTVPGHIDVRVVDGVLHGRGSVDAKGSFCAFVAAVAGLAPALAERLRVTLIGAVGEEAPGSLGARHAVKSLRRPDYVVIGEPSGWDALTLGYKGTMQLELHAAQPSRHTAVDEPTAGEKVVETYGAMRRFVDEHNRAVTQATDAGTIFERLQLRLLSVSATDDGLEQRGRARLGLRLPPTTDVDALAATLLALAQAAEVQFAVQPGAVAAHRSEKGGPLAAAFRTGIRLEGGTPRHTLKTGTSDMNVVAAAWRAGGAEVPPMIAYGPGDSSLDHTPAERLDLAEYLSVIAVLRRALGALAGGTAPATVGGRAGEEP